MPASALRIDHPPTDWLDLRHFGAEAKVMKDGTILSRAVFEDGTKDEPVEVSDPGPGDLRDRIVAAIKEAAA